MCLRLMVEVIKRLKTGKMKAFLRVDAVLAKSEDNPVEDKINNMEDTEKLSKKSWKMDMT